MTDPLTALLSRMKADAGRKIELAQVLRSAASDFDAMRRAMEVEPAVWGVRIVDWGSPLREAAATLECDPALITALVAVAEASEEYEDATDAYVTSGIVNTDTNWPVYARWYLASNRLHAAIDALRSLAEVREK